MSEAKTSWKGTLKNKKFVVQFISVLVALVAVISFLPWYFHYIIGPKPGIHLNDPILALITPVDFTWPIFVLIYLTLIMVLANIVKQPIQLLLALKCYLSILILRVISMYVLTLEPPIGMIVLIDPFIDKIAYGGEPFTKDLFFSGHVSTVMLLGLVEQRSFIKKLIFTSSVILALLIVIQHVHYTIDVLAAPPITFGVFRWLNSRVKKLNYP